MEAWLIGRYLFQMYLMYLQSFYNYSLHLDTSCTKRRLYFRPLGSTDAVLPSAPGNVDNNPDIKPCRFQLCMYLSASKEDVTTNLPF